MQSPLAAPWQGLYGGKIGAQETAIVRLDGLHAAKKIRTRLQALEGAELIIPREKINHSFHHTRQLSVLLKTLSWPLALLLLARIYGWRRGAIMLAVPLSASILTVSALGWLGIPLSLFAILGLLLVMAIGVDYAVYGLSGSQDKTAKRAGMGLACMTTMLTFGLLGFSSTPVVAAFGLTIAIGVFFSAVIAIALGAADVTGEKKINR